MKYVVSSQEKLQNFPIYSMHFDMDSFILYNAEIFPTTGVKILASTQGKSIDEESIAQTLEIAEIIDITDTQGEPHKTENPNLPTKQVSKTPDASCNRENLWYLEFDGSINKLGEGAGIWIHNMQNDCWVKLCSFNLVVVLTQLFNLSIRCP